jgi:p-cumate 2,3-dioxygenase alpha subunit
VRVDCTRSSRSMVRVVFATPDDVAALECAQQGYAAWREVEWNDLSRGLAKTDEQTNTDEGHLRVFWRRWRDLMEGAA